MEPIRFTRLERLVVEDRTLARSHPEILEGISRKLEGTRFMVEVEDHTIPLNEPGRPFFIFNDVDWDAVVLAIQSKEIEVSDDP